MLDKEFIKSKINFIQSELEILSGFKNYSLREIVSDYFKHTVVERIFERVIGDALDINQHIISESGKIQVPNDYKETFLALTNLKILPKKFSEEISKSVGLRNILVHQYRKLNEKLFHKSIKPCLKDYTKYCDYILKFIKP
ncbi:hypothetical protein COT20_01870 [bacterium (Candidatus Gribaldobacteria) CG08_land_8_20_14_0_20_39_15]|uniref:DUF86 domain-containing protein n=1 Tax=bacterium (Candidatus Gribaldobacteria) CG08_land_8_20_14_0_20_39_15 TaxID=2014273 RepID=A0A2M6XUA9_9BACT|nr:MAG: hypothetical protein COT20_01870 [bacterium (Candidatus Gribaldobacteria) CG08_land_8_20_14_0_20_39_15]